MLPEFPQEHIQGRHVVVTGATGALGRGVVARLLQCGAVVHAPILDPAELDGLDWQTVRIQSGVDLREAAQVQAYYQSLPELWASVHLVGGFTMGPFVETSAAELRHMLELNAITAFLCSQAAVEKIRQSPTTPGGRLVNVSARPALVPCGGMVAYAMSKAAVKSLTESLAQELAGEGIWVNAIAPGVIDTPANREAMPDADHSAWPSPLALGRVVSELVLPQNASQTGAVIPVYGRS